MNHTFTHNTRLALEVDLIDRHALLSQISNLHNHRATLVINPAHRALDFDGLIDVESVELAENGGVAVVHDDTEGVSAEGREFFGDEHVDRLGGGYVYWGCGGREVGGRVVGSVGEEVEASGWGEKLRGDCEAGYGKGGGGVEDAEVGGECFADLRTM